MFKNDAELMAYFDQFEFPEGAVEQLRYLRARSPMRGVGRSALTNTVVYLYSPLMQRALLCESRTCEALCYMHQELSGKVCEILPQVELRQVVRLKGKSRHVSTLVADALMLTTSGPIFLECKTKDALEKLCDEKPEEWVRSSTGYRRPSLEAWAEQRGCRYVVWSPPEIHGLLWANYEFIYPLSDGELTYDEMSNARELLKSAREAPISLAAALQANLHLDLRAIGRLIARRALFANLETGLLNHPESIALTSDAGRAGDIESEARKRVSTNLEPLDVTSRILTATRTDLAAGKRRLQRVESMIAGKVQVTRHYAPLVRRVRLAITEGRSPLEECITNYCNSGNTQKRLTDEVYTALDALAEREWEQQGIKDIVELEKALRAHMDALGCNDPTPSTTTIRRSLRRANLDKHNLAFGGKRSFHCHRVATDPQRRTVNAIAPFSMAHIDSTKFDNRSAAETLPDYPFSCPVLYSAIDLGTDEILGRSLTFGPPSRFGLSALLRDIVRRHGRLPLLIMADRGSELWSNMIIAFAAQYAITLIMRPASAARYGSQIECALREINAQVAHRLAGSTRPDQKGRSVDPKFKSYRTARLAFREVIAATDRYLFDLWLDNPIGELGGTPREKKLAAEPYFGRTGRDVDFDDNFILATSVPVMDKVTISAERSLRHEYRTYHHPELRDWIRVHGKPDDARVDCENPALGYAKLGARWVRLTSNEVLEMQIRDELDRIFDRIYTRDAARLARQLKKDNAIKVRANAARANGAMATSDQEAIVKEEQTATTGADTDPPMEKHHDAGIDWAAIAKTVSVGFQVS